MGDLLNIHLSVSKEDVQKVLGSNLFHYSFLIAGFAALIVLRQILGSFGISLGYLYITLISLAGYWFGLKGGIAAAVVATVIFTGEVTLLKGWAARDAVLHGMAVRVMVYFLGGAAVGYLSEMDRRMKKELEGLAYYDKLTGCVNLPWAVKFLDNEIERSKRKGRKVTVVMAGIDDLKAINSKWGHAAGDEVIRSFAYLLKDNLRKADIVARYRGDEFLVIFPEVAPEQAMVILERIRSRMEERKTEFHHLRDKKYADITFSAGMAYFPYNGDIGSDLIDCAGSALYQCKITGKNKVLLERRTSIRVKALPGLVTEIIDSLGSEPVRTLEVNDISRKGLQMGSREDFDTGEFHCRIQFPYEHFPSEFTCRVVHRERCAGGSYCVGASFVDVPRHTEERLAKYIERAKDAPLLF